MKTQRGDADVGLFLLLYQAAPLKTKLKMAIDICKGMRYLSERNYVHRVSVAGKTRLASGGGFFHIASPTDIPLLRISTHM